MSLIEASCVGLLTVYGFETRQSQSGYAVPIRNACVGLLTVYGFETAVVIRHIGVRVFGPRFSPYRLRF